VKGFGGGRKAQGARRMKQARPIVATRSPDAALGRETRGLVGAPKRGRSGPASRALPSLPTLRRPGTGIGGLRRPGIGRLVSPARAAALLGMLASGFLLTFVTGPSAFALTRADVPELQWTSDADVRAALAIPEGANVFRLDTAPMEAALEALPGVASAEVGIRLPDGVVAVTIQERVPILAWEVGEQRFLADREGVIFAAVGRGAELPGGVAVIEDRRSGSAERLGIGSRLDPVDLDVATRLGSLKPADVGSAESRLRVRITNPDGFVVFTEGGWTAVFGFYSPATRPTAIIPGQVRLLRSFLVQHGEEAVARVILASDTAGTYVPKATPKPTKK
jgi:cell division protein FtsQ